MGKTAIYQLPWPELPDTADGPDGYEDLALATEAGLTQVRNQIAPVSQFTDHFFNTPGAAMPNGAVAWGTGVLTFGAMTHNRVASISLTAYCNAGSIVANLFVNNIIVRAVGAAVLGTASVVHLFNLPANTQFTCQIQIGSRAAGSNWSGDNRFSRLQIAANPI